MNRLYSRAIHSPTRMEKHYVHWFILKSVQDITVCEKIRFCLPESGRTKPWCPGLVSRTSAKAQEPLARSRGLVIQPPKYSSFQQVRQPSIPSPVEEDTSKIRDMTGTVFIQGPTIVLPVGAYFELLFLGCGFLIHLSNRSDSPRFRASWKKIRQKYGRQQEPSLFKGHPLSCQYGEALCSMVPS